jgi:hypothetical protein
MYHYRKTRKSYTQKLREDTAKNICTFCSDAAPSGGFIEETEHARVIPNRTHYDLWEGRYVAEHYLVVPKLCVGSLNELPDDAARLDIMNIIATYEQQGFNVYARAVGSPLRSVRHQHTHLIKFSTQPHPKYTVYIEKPYTVLAFRSFRMPRAIKMLYTFPKRRYQSRERTS